MIADPRDTFIACYKAVDGKLLGRKEDLVTLAHRFGRLQTSKREVDAMLDMTLREIAALASASVHGP